MVVRRVLMLSASLVLVGCSLKLDGFVCGPTATCGAGRSCIEQSCALPDNSCASGFRWDDSAGARDGHCTVANMGADLGDMSATFDSAVDSAPPEGDLGVVCGVNAFCEDFESGNLDPWMQRFQNAVGVIDTTRAQSGQHAFHITTSAATDMSSLPTIAALTLKSAYFEGMTQLWTRVYIYIDSPLPTAFTPIFFLQQASSPFLESQVSLDQDHHITFNNLLVTPNDTTATSATVSAGQWVCVEYYVQISDDGPIQVAIDGTFDSAKLTSNTVATPPLAGFALYWGGAATAGDPGPHQIWYDDIVLSTTRVGCAF